ncbi:alkaline phosphatase [candidate division KSB1 bacterium]|nr:alkaline phosphatase [candidate division KSB1 bacterium]NIR72515.1 alkaline phosphatase [candidate division KSB1 bacterium]NIS23623.1 alkaline phosphatase [candidate division KSB1 bacterium]NIT70549.1 alkaline phosphatase [candidate division KSB1 bacterium]NIU24256.1 alkaline phosphatase [candidate division KSB1 bacterium]
MKLKQISILAAVLFCSIVVGYAVLQSVRKHFNIGLVFYKVGQSVAISEHKRETKPYPLLPDNKVRNIILFIGDGMGMSHITSARCALAGPNDRLNIERMPVTGLVTTHSIDDLVTDSAAAGTALATGVKTTNGHIGVDLQGKSHPTILEVARDAGLSTGLVTTTSLADATPAVFASHVLDRAMKDEIALQLLRARVNVLFGEGEDFYPGTDPHSTRKDEVNPIAFARELGYAVIDKKEDLANADAGFLLGLFEDLTIDKREPELHSRLHPPNLSELTAKAIALLNRNEKGFFLVVEEEGVDLGSHVNRPDYFIQHLKNLDEAVKVGIDFALSNKQTLVIVTADHETGGLNIVSSSQAEKRIELIWDTDKHTGQPVPLFALGPHAFRFTGLKDNTEIPRILAELLRLDKFPSIERISHNDSEAQIASYPGKNF